MLPEHHVPLEDERCPVSDELLGELYRTSAHGLDELIATVPPKVRALLAVYCYRRAHLASIGLAIAATCEQDDLAECGNIGAVLFERSRETPVTSSPNGHATNRRKITLATKPIQQRSQIEDVESLALSRSILQRAASVLPKLGKSLWS